MARAWPRTAVVNDGEFPFACDPKLATSAAPVIWRPELVPHSVILVRAPPSFTNAHRLATSDLAGHLIDYDGSDGRHVVLRAPHGAHRLWLRDAHTGMGMAAI